MITEEEAVRALAERIGYGRVMQLAEEAWREKDPGAEHTVGPCATLMVPCSHPVRDASGHCEVCCGAGRVTRWVAENMPTGPQKAERYRHMKTGGTHMITDKMVEDGARALHDAARNAAGHEDIGYWDEYNDDWRAGFRKLARAVLEAALAGPLAATRDELMAKAKEFWNNLSTSGTWDEISALERCQVVINVAVGELRGRAGHIQIPRPVMTQPYHAKIDNVRRDGVSLVFHTREEAQQVMEALNHDAG